jgi:Thioredoxin-like
MPRLLVILLLLASAHLAFCYTMPLSAKDVSLMLRSGYSNEAVLRELSVRHFVGALDPATEKQLTQVGASESLIDALRSERYQASPSEIAAAQEKFMAEKQSATPAIQQPRDPKTKSLGDERPKTQAQGGAPGTTYRLVKGDLVYWHEETVTSFDDEVLENKRLYLFFFSAFGSPQGRKFTPQLIDYYNRVAPAHPEFEVVFFSLDRSQFAMETYLSQTRMPWPAVAYDKLSQKEEIIKNLVRGIPCLVLLNANGEVLSTNGGGPTDPGPDKVLADLDKILARNGG